MYTPRGTTVSVDIPRTRGWEAPDAVHDGSAGAGRSGVRRRLLVPIVMCTVASTCASAGGGCRLGHSSGVAHVGVVGVGPRRRPGDVSHRRRPKRNGRPRDPQLPDPRKPQHRSTNQPFSITVRPVTALSPAVQASFSQAAARWSTIITRFLGNVAINLPAGFCVAGSAPLTGTISGVVIDVHVAAIDGAGGILGQSGPCVLGPTDNLRRVGTLWNYTRSLLSGPASSGGTDDRYTGARAVAEYSKLGGTSGVPSKPEAVRQPPTPTGGNQPSAPS